MDEEASGVGSLLGRSVTEVHRLLPLHPRRHIGAGKPSVVGNTGEDINHVCHDSEMWPMMRMIERRHTAQKGHMWWTSEYLSQCRISLRLRFSILVGNVVGAK